MSMEDRTQLLLGPDGVERLKNSSVVLVGCGAVGGYVLEGFVRAGVGRIRVYDHDVFSDSNLNRQILATTETIGRTKVDVACERARSINPSIDIEGKDVLVNEETVPEILSGEFDILVDAIDTVRNKAALLRYAAKNGIMTFSSMGAARHLDATSIRVAPLKSTKVCPIAASMRRELREFDTSRIITVYSTEQPITTPAGRDDFGKSVLGSLPTVPAIFGMTLANEAIRYLVRGDDI